MPEIIIVAGPNGAGKTSFANKHFDVPRPGLVYVNADEIARRLDRTKLSQQEIDLRAGREMLKRIGALVTARSSFMLETTLASLAYLRKIRQWREAGFRIALVYLRLPSVEMSLERVRRRVARGGHGISEDVIRQRYAKSIDCLEKHYKFSVDEWYVWDSLEGDFRPAEALERLTDTIINVQEVQAELERAARDAESGPAEVRAGRFVHDTKAKATGGINRPIDQQRPVSDSKRIE